MGSLAASILMNVLAVVWNTYLGLLLVKRCELQTCLGDFPTIHYKRNSTLSVLAMLPLLKELAL